MKTLRLPHTNPRFAIALVVIAAGYALFSFLTPFQYDDFAFLGSYLQHSNNDPTFSLDSFLGTCAEIRKYDNGRLANILDLFVIVCVPKWIFDVLTGAVTAGIFYFITVFIVSCAPRRAAHNLSFPVVTVCWALSMVALPCATTCWSLITRLTTSIRHSSTSCFYILRPSVKTRG